MRRLSPSVFALAGAVLVCGTAVALGAANASSPVLRAPAGTAAHAAADARAALGRLTLPGASRRLGSVPRALRGPLEPDFTMGFVTFETATAFWSLASADAVTALLAQAPRGATSWSYPGDVRGVQITLASEGSWMGPRWLVIEAKPDPSAAGHWLAEIQAVAVWTPWRLELPNAPKAVIVRRLANDSVLATVTDAARVARIVAAVDGLAVDDAVHAVYHCPSLPIGARPGFELSFVGTPERILATASTEWCPADLSLEVGTHGRQQLILGDLVAQLEKILAIKLPPVF